MYVPFVMSGFFGLVWFVFICLLLLVYLCPSWLPWLVLCFCFFESYSVECFVAVWFWCVISLVRSFFAVSVFLSMLVFSLYILNLLIACFVVSRGVGLLAFPAVLSFYRASDGFALFLCFGPPGRPISLVTLFFFGAR